MQTIFVDVTNLTKVDFLTGIQRVVGNISLEMYKKIPEKLTFISFNETLFSEPLFINLPISTLTDSKNAASILACFFTIEEHKDNA